MIKVIKKYTLLEMQSEEINMPKPTTNRDWLTESRENIRLAKKQDAAALRNLRSNNNV